MNKRFFKGKNRGFLENFWKKLGIFAFYFSIILFLLFLPRIYNFFDSIFLLDKTINIYTFTDIISLDAVEEFEKQTGIQVRIRYFDTNEDLLAKFKISRGEGYDLITASDYMIELIRRENLLQEIDHSKLSNIKNLDERLLNKYFDPGNRFSLPFAWSVYGIIYSKEYFGNKKITWDDVFKHTDSRDYKICMLEDPLEIIILSSIYLFQRTQDLSKEDFKKIEQMLKAQKNWVESYTFSGAAFFLVSGTVSLAVVPGYVGRKIVDIDEDFKFVVPDKGTLLSIENMAIPTKSKKADLVYKFIDFMISKEIGNLSNFENGYNPVNKTAYDTANVKYLKKKMLFPPDHIFGKLHMINNKIPLKKINKIWLNVRAN